MKRTLFTTPLLILALSTCVIAVQPPMNESTHTESPSPPQKSIFIPSSADSKLIRGIVYLDSTELRTLESFPLQFMLTMKGSLPTPCHQLRVSVSPTDADNKVIVNIYSVSNPDEMCAQVLEPFEVNFPLGSFPAGRYTLWVNGEMVTEFQS
ncbi:MAG: hypothetical protein ACYC6R_16190 [Anaerolineales bacterium]